MRQVPPLLERLVTCYYCVVFHIMHFLCPCFYYDTPYAENIMVLDGCWGGRLRRRTAHHISFLRRYRGGGRENGQARI